MKTLKYSLFILLISASLSSLASESIFDDLTTAWQNSNTTAHTSTDTLTSLAANIDTAKNLWENAKEKAAAFTEQAKDLYTKYVAARDLFQKVAGAKTTEIEEQIAQIKKAPADVQANYQAELEALKAKYENLKKETKETVGSTDWNAIWEKGKELFQNNSGLLDGLFGNSK